MTDATKIGLLMNTFLLLQETQKAQKEEQRNSSLTSLQEKLDPYIEAPSNLQTPSYWNKFEEMPDQGSAEVSPRDLMSLQFFRNEPSPSPQPSLKRTFPFGFEEKIESQQPFTPYDSSFFKGEARTLLGESASPDSLDALTNALQQFSFVGLLPISAETHLKAFVKEGKTVDLAPYGLQRDIRQRAPIGGEYLDAIAQMLNLKLSSPDTSECRRGTYFTQRWYDARYQFCLTYERACIANVGFDVQPGHLLIRQIQGAPGRGGRLAPLKWERALVNYVLQWADEQGIPEVRCIRGEDQIWVKEGKLQPQQARMLYDVTAQRVRYQGRKFTFDETSKQYVFRFGEGK